MGPFFRHYIFDKPAIGFDLFDGFPERPRSKAMQRMDIYAFYKLGTEIHALERISKDNTARPYLTILRDGPFFFGWFVAGVCPSGGSGVSGDSS